MKKTYLFTTLLLYLLMANATLAYPPDNAAVLYYKNMADFEKPDESVWDEISDLPTSTIPASEKAKSFLKSKEHNLIWELEIASQLEHCDWGFDLTQGFELLMPGLSDMKHFSILMLADAAVNASEGNIDVALDRNLTTRRMAHHVTNDTLIGFLVSMAIDKKCNEAFRHLLSTYPVDEKILINLKNELMCDNYRPKSIRHPLMLEKGVCLQEITIMTPKRFRKVMGGSDCNGEQTPVDQRILKLLSKDDPTFVERSTAYLEKYYDNIFRIMEKPYTQAFQETGVALKKVEEEAEKGKDDAVFTAIFCPPLAQCYNHGIHWKTNYDAMLTALNVYIIAAKTGKLPEQLPESTYIDHFSGKPFIYELTDDGFTLRCQQEDLVKNITHEYTYKLP